MTPRRRTATANATGSSLAATWKMRLYVAGPTPRALATFATLRQLCEEHLHGHYTIEVINLVKTPALASADQIIALPTVVRKLPGPVRTLIGDLTNTEKVLVGLDLIPAPSPH